MYRHDRPRHLRAERPPHCVTTHRRYFGGDPGPGHRLVDDRTLGSTLRDREAVVVAVGVERRRRRRFGGDRRRQRRRNEDRHRDDRSRPHHARPPMSEARKHPHRQSPLLPAPRHEYRAWAESASRSASRTLPAVDVDECGRHAESRRATSFAQRSDVRHAGTAPQAAIAMSVAQTVADTSGRDTLPPLGRWPRHMARSTKDRAPSRHSPLRISTPLATPRPPTCAAVRA